MEPPSKVIELLPSTPAKWALWLAITLSALLYFLLQWLQVDTLLPLAIAQKLSLLLPSAVLLLVGVFMVLFFVVRAHNEQSKQLAIVEESLKAKSQYGKVPPNQFQDKINYPPSGVV